MRVETEPKLDFSDVLIRPKRSSLTTRAEVSLERTFTTLHAGVPITGVPIVAANMDSVGTIEMSKALSEQGLFTALHKHYSIDDLKEVELPSTHNFMTFGFEGTDHMKTVFDALGNQAFNKICLDVANGYTEKFVDYIKDVRTAFPDKIIMAGNVTTPDMTEALLLAGADIVKIGIGPGSVCKTRDVTGVGYPQLSSIIECADAAHGLGGLICADGGCRTSGDISKAFGAGADFVMIGGMLAGHDESISEEQRAKLAENDNTVEYYGMSSTEAMTKYAGGVAEHRASEGEVRKIPYRGPVKDTILSILGGIRSTCTYVGASELKQLSKRTTFIIKR